MAPGIEFIADAFLMKSYQKQPPAATVFSPVSSSTANASTDLKELAKVNSNAISKLLLPFIPYAIDSQPLSLLLH